MGAALQKVVAFANMICYYVFSLSVGAALMFATQMGLLGKVSRSSSFFSTNQQTNQVKQFQLPIVKPLEVRGGAVWLQIH